MALFVTKPVFWRIVDQCKLLLNIFYCRLSRLHEGQEVTLKMEGIAGEPKGKVVQLDNDGYLVIRLKDNGQLVTAHPDGNSFDMMQGLIVPKVAKWKPWNVTNQDFSKTVLNGSRCTKHQNSTIDEINTNRTSSKSISHLQQRGGNQGVRILILIWFEMFIMTKQYVHVWIINAQNN